MKAPFRSRSRRSAGVAVPVGLPGADHLQIEARRLRIGDGLRASFAVVGYPRDVRPGWLEPLLTWPGPVDVALYVEPMPAAIAADRLRRQLARLESSRRVGADRGQLDDPGLDVAAEDARDLAERLARGEGRLFRVGLYVTVRASDEDNLDREVERLRALLSSLLLDAQPATFRMLAGWTTTLPLGLDLLGLRRTFDTAALAAGFPFASAELSSDGGVLYGLNARSQGLVFWDRFAQPNYNSVVLARSGAGKSYFVKLELARSLYLGIEVGVIDPEDEYERLATALGGVHIRLGAPGVRLNPFDLTNEPDAFTRRALFLHSLVGTLVGGLDGRCRAVLDRAIVATYQAAGITADPTTHHHTPPVLADLARHLEGEPIAAAQELSARLMPFTTGTHRGLFDGQTTLRPGGHLVVYSLRELPDELRSIGTLLALDRLWRRVCDSHERRRRLIVVDEAWLLMREPEGARFLLRLAKSARKRWCGLSVVTQDAADVLGSDLGVAVVANAATQVLFRQAPQSIDALTNAFRLSSGEANFLLGAERGTGLLVAGTERAAFHVVASEVEDRLVTTDPAFLSSRARSEAGEVDA